MRPFAIFMFGLTLHMKFRKKQQESHCRRPSLPPLGRRIGDQKLCDVTHSQGLLSLQGCTHQF